MIENVGVPWWEKRHIETSPWVNTANLEDSRSEAIRFLGENHAATRMSPLPKSIHWNKIPQLSVSTPHLPMRLTTMARYCQKSATKPHTAALIHRPFQRLG